MATHLICADDPGAMVMRGANWRLRISPNGMVVTHGALPADVLRHIEGEISSNLNQIVQLSNDWREGWAKPAAVSHDAEDFPEFG